MSHSIKLNSSETTIPRIGYGAGTRWFSGDNSQPLDQGLIKSIQDAISIGYRHLDTAEMYGTDASIAEALHQQLIPRSDIYITSKVSHNIADIEKACSDVLSRLNTDYLDLWLIHAPFFDRNKTSLEQAWKQMESLVEKGKVKAIGVSNFQKAHLEELLALSPKIMPAVNQIELHPYVYEASKELVEYCKINGIAIESYSPLASLCYKPGGPVDEVVDRLAKKYNRSSAQILLKWNLVKGDIIITTSNKVERLVDFLKVLDDDFRLNDEDVQAIDDAGAKLHFRRYWTEKIDGKTSS